MTGTKKCASGRSKTDDKNPDLFPSIEVNACSGLAVKYCTVFCPTEWLQQRLSYLDKWVTNRFHCSSSIFPVMF